ncbi:hypothetical protein ABEV15_04585 [Bhargavaea massiliensis]
MESILYLLHSFLELLSFIIIDIFKARRNIKKLQKLTWFCALHSSPQYKIYFQKIGKYKKLTSYLSNRATVKALEHDIEERKRLIELLDSIHYGRRS